eukprot:1170180-Lingulodinium_polyedra.AAC.1
MDNNELLSLLDSEQQLRSTVEVAVQVLGTLGSVAPATAGQRPGGSDAMEAGAETGALHGGAAS